jgi:hypothetical protein
VDDKSRRLRHGVDQADQAFQVVGCVVTIIEKISPGSDVSIGDVDKGKCGLHLNAYLIEVRLRRM